MTAQRFIMNAVGGRWPQTIIDHHSQKHVIHTHANDEEIHLHQGAFIGDDSDVSLEVYNLLGPLVEMSGKDRFERKT